MRRRLVEETASCALIASAAEADDGENNESAE